MGYLPIPSFPSYEINELHDIRNIRTKKPVHQENGMVTLYRKNCLVNTNRSARKLYEETLFSHNQSSDLHNNPSSIAPPGEMPSEAPAPSSGLASDLLTAILNRYRNIPPENLSHKECIDLLKVLMDRTKKEPLPRKEGWDGYMTPEMYERIHERTKNRDYSGNTLKDVEEIYREYAPRKNAGHDKARQPLRCVR